MTVPDRKQITVLMDGNRLGAITEGAGGTGDRLELTYDDAWRANRYATPLSLSMPLAVRSHPDQVVRAYLWGLLPDNEQILDRWARRYQVSARNPFALLRQVGEDCAGAAQFVRPEREDALLRREGGVNWLGDAAIADRLRTLRRDPSAWHPATGGQFSLAGAQAKLALHHDPQSGRWGDPTGAVPTTHILKPAVVGLDDHDLNEHLCLQAARRVGLNAARSTVVSFATERAVAVQRYDRARAADGTVQRIHQEDLCQALGMLPTAKYQSDGGPSPEQIADLLREWDVNRAAGRSMIRFAEVLAYNWIIGGTDAHAKNYSVLLAGGRVRLAPMYDIASALPYDDMYLPKLRMAMRIGGEYRLEAISGRHWRRFAEAVRLDPDALLAHIDDLAARVPAALAAAEQDNSVQSLASDLPARLIDRVTARAGRCRAALVQ